jgi:demethylmenaquinone methyltransferase/2-methoxy-6-polyprenyl-1,4-benzoquinol methylase
MSEDKNPQKIRSMFDEVSCYYDFVNNLISFGTHYLLRYLAIRELKIEPRSNVLDTCCGTGDFVKIIKRLSPKTKVIGLDFSPKMVKLAKQKNPKGTFIVGDCTNLPFGEGEFDYVTNGFGLRNIENGSKALDEIIRVLKKGGKFLHMDFGYHNIFWSILDWVVPVLIRILGKDPDAYGYLLKTKKEFPEPDELVQKMEEHGFRCVKVCNYLFGTISVQIVEKL